MTMREILDEAAASLEPAPEVRETADGAVEWAVNGTVFADLEGPEDAVSFRLDPTLASAAARTPDTAAHTRGNPWIVFAPGELDAHAIDRAVAWFQAAYRRALEA